MNSLTKHPITGEPLEGTFDTRPYRARIERLAYSAGQKGVGPKLLIKTARMVVRLNKAVRKMEAHNFHIWSRAFVKASRWFRAYVCKVIGEDAIRRWWRIHNDIVTGYTNSRQGLGRGPDLKPRLITAYQDWKEFGLIPIEPLDLSIKPFDLRIGTIPGMSILSRGPKVIPQILFHPAELAPDPPKDIAGLLKNCGHWTDADNPSFADKTEPRNPFSSSKTANSYSDDEGKDKTTKPRPNPKPP